MTDFHFLRPQWLLALLPFGFAVWWFLRARGRGGAWSRVCDAALLPFIVQQGGARRTPWGGWLATCAGAFAIVALAGPVWERLPVPVFRGESALVIALDLSTSMNATDIKPSRLERAKFKITDILRQRTTGQTALVVFAAQSFVVTPLTDDSTTLTAQLQALDTSIMPNQGSEPATALEQAGKLLLQAGVPAGHVLLITDGADDDAQARAKSIAVDASYRLSVLGVGTADGAPVPDVNGGFVRATDGEIVLSTLAAPALRALATAGDGIYLEAAADDRDVDRLAQYLDDDHYANAQRLKQLASNQWHEVGPWLLLPVLPLAALAFRRGVLVLLLALLLPMASREATAGWWQTPDQAGHAAFGQGRYADAAAAFADPAWRGAAHYRAGDFAGAVTDYAANESALAHYNRGNALARQGRYEDAIKAYDEALQRAPDDADAKYNKALLEQILEQQGSPEQKKPGQDSAEDQRKQADTQGGENQVKGEKGGKSKEDSAGATNAGGGAPSEKNEHEDAAGDDNRVQGQAEDTEREKRETKLTGAKEKERDSSGQLATAQSESDAERAQATEQWLRQIPDDPAGLLRRKFQYQYKQMYGDQPYSGNHW